MHIIRHESGALDTRDSGRVPVQPVNVARSGGIGAPHGEGKCPGPDIQRFEKRLAGIFRLGTCPGRKNKAQGQYKKNDIKAGKHGLVFLIFH